MRAPLSRRLFARRYSVRFATEFDELNKKPTIGQFKYPLFHVFLIASSTYMAMNAWWYALEYEQTEKKLKEQSAVLDSQLQAALEEINATKKELLHKKHWYYLWLN